MYINPPGTNKLRDKFATKAITNLVLDSSLFSINYYVNYVFAICLYIFFFRTLFSNNSSDIDKNRSSRNTFTTILSYTFVGEIFGGLLNVKLIHRTV